MPRITLIRGDGIGPEVMDAAVRVLEATGVELEWEEEAAGAGAIPKHGAPLPKSTLDSIKRTRCAFKGPLETPVGGGYSSVNVALRQEFELYVNVRPARSYKGVNTPFENVDLVLIRENTQGLYSGIEFYTDIKKTSAQALSLITRAASERCIRYAFKYAKETGRTRLTLVHKANILKLTTGMFLEVGRELSREFPEIRFDDRIVDNMAMQLVTKPQQFEVIVTTNLFGDILSDLTAGLVGGLGLAPSSNIGTDVAIFEAIHGTAPDIAGKGIANPSSAILSGAMMLRHLGFADEATRVETAVRAVLADGEVRTPDLGGKANTAQYAKAIIERLS